MRAHVLIFDNRRQRVRTLGIESSEGSKSAPVKPPPTKPYLIILLKQFYELGTKY